jgi:hypothetical protein
MTRDTVMNDNGSPGPPDDVPVPESDSAPESEGLWRRYRSWPLWVQIVAPLVVIAVIVGGVVWATSASDGETASSGTTTASGGQLELVVKGLIVSGALDDDSSVSTTNAPASTSPESTISSASATTSPATTTSSTHPASTAPAGPVTPTTAVPPPTTAAPSTAVPTTQGLTTNPPATSAPPDTTETPDSTEVPDTTDAPDTTEVPDTTDAPPTTVEPSPSLPTVAAFFDQWNEATAGTDVPTISGVQLEELTGDYAGYYLAPLSPTDDDSFPPQVGVVGTATSPGSGQLEKLLLVWIPGPDESSSDFYWKAFGVLVQAVSPGTPTVESEALATTLGEAPGTPPFTTTNSASQRGLDLRTSSIAYTGEAGNLNVSAIEVR